MSMYPEPIFDVPELTAEVAKAAFPKGGIDITNVLICYGAFDELPE
jgi:hypothetical protein